MNFVHNLLVTLGLFSIIGLGAATLTAWIYALTSALIERRYWRACIWGGVFFLTMSLYTAAFVTLAQ